MRTLCNILVLLLSFLASSAMVAQGGLRQANLSSFVEYGASVHAGDNTPLWQVSNQHGLSSLDNNTYLRGGAFYADTIRRWRLEGGLDMAVATGFTSRFVLQQAYADIRYDWFGLIVGSKEIDSPLLNRQLSSGGLLWSGNARPVPQVWIGLPEYVQVLPRLALKAEISYGWFTDNNYQEEKVGENFWYTKSIKYHHKSGFLRIGVPHGRWQLDVGMSMDVQFGGYKSAGMDAGDLGNEFGKIISRCLSRPTGMKADRKANGLLIRATLWGASMSD